MLAKEINFESEDAECYNLADLNVLQPLVVSAQNSCAEFKFFVNVPQKSIKTVIFHKRANRTQNAISENEA